MIKAAFFDIDGTLLTHNGGFVPEDTRYALRCLKNQGIYVFTSTGRHILELEELSLTALGFDGYVLLNGQLCLDREQKILYALPVDPEDIQNVRSIFENRLLPLSFVEQNRLYVNYIDERVKKAQKEISSDLPPLGNWQGEPVYLVVAFAGEEDVSRLLEKMPHCKKTRWNPYGVDIIARGGGKVVGMQKMMEHFGIRREEIIAFGDGENDVEMLSYAGIGVAMENGAQCAKACADYVTGRDDQGGILQALRHYHILEE